MNINTCVFFCALSKQSTLVKCWHEQSTSCVFSEEESAINDIEEKNIELPAVLKPMCFLAFFLNRVCPRCNTAMLH